MVSSNEISPAYSSGVHRMAPTILSTWFLLTTTYFAILRYFRGSSEITVLGKPAPEYCQETKDDELCNRADLLAFQVSSGIALAACAAIGFSTWHLNKRAHCALPSTSEGRLFGYLPEAEFLAAIGFAFQSFDFVISTTIPEHSTAILLGHHVMAATVSWCSVQFQVLHYYGIFFLGISEVSSIFLVFLDLAKYFPPEPGTFYDALVNVCGPFFVFSFISYRVIVWWPESFRLFMDVRSVVESGRAQKLRPGRTWVLYLFLVLNLPLGILQLYWTTIIFGEVKKVLQPQQNGWS